MLNLSRQEQIRRRYKAMRPGYQTGLDVYTGLLSGIVTSTTRLLDAGCGPGGLVKGYVGLADLVVGADRYASHFAEPAEIPILVESDLNRLPFPARSLDIITCSWVLEHLRQPEAVFAEFHRVLKPGGHLLFITPNARNYTVWLRRLIPGRLSKPVVKAIYARDEDFINPTFYRANTFHAIHRPLTRLGFACERFDHVGDPTYLAINEVLFRAAVLLESLIDRFWPTGRVHLVGLYSKK